MSQSEWQIREMTGDDAQTFYALRYAALLHFPDAFGQSAEEWQALSLETIRERLENNHQRPDQIQLGCFINENMVGCVNLGRHTSNKNRHKGYIWGMAVARDHQGKGIGQALMQEILHRARQMKGLEQIHLHVEINNAAAKKLYENFGFQPVAIHKGDLKIGERYVDLASMVYYTAPEYVL